MPYIPEPQRSRIRPTVFADSEGELAYQFAELIDDYIRKNGLSFSTLADISGVLELSKLEFWRRVVVPYEEKKRQENGDVSYGEFSE